MGEIAGKPTTSAPYPEFMQYSRPNPASSGKVLASSADKRPGAVSGAVADKRNFLFTPPPGRLYAFHFFFVYRSLSLSVFFIFLSLVLVVLKKKTKQKPPRVLGDTKSTGK